MTIFWAVISIIISSVKRHSWKRMAHICEKILEFLPSSADSYAPSAIILESSTTSIIASLMHSAPYLIDLESFSIGYFPAHSVGSGIEFSSELAAARNLPVNNTGFESFNFSAYASAYKRSARMNGMFAADWISGFATRNNFENSEISYYRSSDNFLINHVSPSYAGPEYNTMTYTDDR